MISPAEPTRSSDPKVRWALGLAALGVLVALLLASGRIDFHPDEAIYFDAIPVQLRSDAGLLYELAYGPAWAMHSLLLARAISCLFAMGAFLACVLLKGPEALTPLRIGTLGAIFVLSYPVIFHGARVRPEISWIFTATACAAMLAHFRRNNALRSAVIASVLLFLTGLNHKLAWFAILYISVYCGLEFLIRPQQRLGLFLVLCGAVAGPIVNQLARAVWLHADIAASLAALASKPDVPRHQSVSEFLTFIFNDAGLFLADQAANRGWVQAAFDTDDAHFSDYYLLNASLAASPIMLALARTPRQALCFGFPAFFLLACFATGYYNPTYAPFLMQIMAVACASVLMARPSDTFLSSGRRWIAGTFLLYLLALSTSFIVTRIVEQGQTGTFRQFAFIQKTLQDLHADGARSFLISERFRNAVPADARLDESFKDDPDLSKTDVLIYDDYDERMYAFVPDFEGRKARMLDYLKTQCVVSSTRYLVYPKGITYPNPYRPGSWFFRHSVGGTLTIAKRCRN